VEGACIVRKEEGGVANIRKEEAVRSHHSQKGASIARKERIKREQQILSWMSTLNVGVPNNHDVQCLYKQ
jgi:hypothetical protein